MKINIMAEKFGYVTQVIGPVVDVIFEKDGEDLPPIYEALRIERDNGEKLIIEVEQHIGEDTVRCVAMDTTDGLRRGMKAWDLGRTLTMPVGKQIKGRLLNVTGDAIDKLGKLDYTDTLSIHREPPRFEDLTTTQELLLTGIKVIDLLAPYSKGGKIGLFGGAGVGERTREGNDLLREMIESGVVKYGERFQEEMNEGKWDVKSVDMEQVSQSQATLVFGQMNEPPGARLRVALSGLTVAESFRDSNRKSCFLSIIFSGLLRRVRKCRPCWDVCLRLLDISRHWLLRWESYRSGSLLLNMVPSLRYRLFMYLPTT